MCGIIGVTGVDDALPLLLEGLGRLEYRGYDSAGVALIHGTELWRNRAADGTHSVGDLRPLGDDVPAACSSGIGHTRWATHGKPATVNAHPHLDCSGRLALVHNGIIENYDEIAGELEADRVPAPRRAGRARPRPSPIPADHSSAAAPSRCPRAAPTARRRNSATRSARAACAARDRPSAAGRAGGFP